MKGREEKIGEQWKGKVAHHRKGNKKRKYYWLRSVCKTERKSSALCVHAYTNTALLTLPIKLNNAIPKAEGCYENHL